MADLDDLPTTEDLLAANAVAQATVVDTQIALTDYFKLVGATYETVPRWSSRGADVQHTNGNIHSSAICLPAGLVISSISFVTGATGGLGMTNQFFCLQDNLNNQLAVTIDDGATAWPAVTAKTLPIGTTADNDGTMGGPVTYTTTYTGLYYLGYTCVVSGGGSAQPYLQATAVPFAHASTTDLPLLCGVNGIGVGSIQAFPYNAGALSAIAGAVIDYAFVS
jgi:hypothetical protein